MPSHPVSIWASFSDAATAGRALARLESLGVRNSQIAVHKHFQKALTGFDWPRAFYMRLPEGIVFGFGCGALAGAAASCLVSSGVPDPLVFSALAMGGSLAGVVIGALGGLAYARLEPALRGSKIVDEEEPIEIGVQCFDARAEGEAKRLLLRMGASAVDTVE